MMVTLEWRLEEDEEASHEYTRKRITDKGNSKCKGPAAGACLIQTIARGESGWSRVNKGENSE